MFPDADFTWLGSLACEHVHNPFHPPIHALLSLGHRSLLTLDFAKQACSVWTDNTWGNITVSIYLNIAVDLLNNRVGNTHR